MEKGKEEERKEERKGGGQIEDDKRKKGKEYYQMFGFLVVDLKKKCFFIEVSLSISVDWNRFIWNFRFVLYNLYLKRGLWYFVKRF